MSGDEEKTKKSIPLDAAKKEVAGSPEDDAKAAAEAKQLGSGNTVKEIEEAARKNEVGRQETFRDHFEIIAIISLWGVWAAISLVGTVWVYHLVAPECWPRLPEQRIQTLQAILTGGVIAGVASGHLKRRIGS